MNPKEMFEKAYAARICVNVAKVEEILRSKGFEVLKDCPFKMVSNSQFEDEHENRIYANKEYRTAYWRDKGLIVALEIQTDTQTNVRELNWISFIQRIINANGSYAKIRKVGLTGSFPSIQSEFVYLNNQLHTGRNDISAFAPILELCMQVCDNSYNFDSEKHCLINSHTASLRKEMGLPRDYFFTIGEILNANTNESTK